MIELGSEICRDQAQASSREWLETNGLGGYASGTVGGINTRRYHGALVASIRPPVERLVLLSKLEETLVVGGQRFELSANQYPGAVSPQGFLYLESFRLDPFPVWIFRAGPVRLEKRLFMIHGENTTVVQYAASDVPSGVPVTLEIRPLIAFRDYHSLTHQNPALAPAFHEGAGQVALQPYPDLPDFFLAHDAVEVEGPGYWYHSFEYLEEQARGLDFVEDLFQPLMLQFDLAARPSASVIATLSGARRVEEAPDLEAAERERREALIESAPVEDPLCRALTAAADQFLVRREQGETVIAGYHWFADWGRDTMIALPGLALVTGRFDTARDILKEFAAHVNQGLLPNRFPDRGEQPEYNTVDATLWFFQAIQAYGRYTGDYAFIQESLYPVLADILEWHARGTLHGIHLDSDGLIQAGAEGVQLTWMDAKVGDYVVTPRRGRPVEIQALWYNALRVMQDLAVRFGDEASAKEYARSAAQASRSFNRLFWNADLSCLYDVVDGDRPDPSLRPNQILAVSLPYTMLSREKGKKVVAVVQRHLLTPYGLRTLSPEDDRYCGVYEGDPWNRDVRYHMGTVWPWLMGPFVSAHVRVNGGTAKSRHQAGCWLTGLRDHLTEAGLGQISEILDGDAPYHPRGCIAQAWSVGEVLRCLVEDVFAQAPGEAG